MEEERCNGEFVAKTTWMGNGYVDSIQP